MNENDLFDTLAAPSKEKLAGIMDSLKMVPRATIEYVKAHPQEVAGALVGAGALTLAQYTQNRPGKDGTSVQQRLSQRAVDATEDMKDEAERTGKPLGFFKDLTQATAPAIKGVSDVLARHPIKGALLVAPAGASLGYGLASKFLKHGSAKPCVTKKATMTKLSAMADQWGRDLAHEMVKEATPPGSLFGHGVGRLMQGAVSTSLRTRAVGGAALGAAGGAAKHMMKPKDEQGRRQGSLVGSMAGGAAIGAGVGAGARAAAQHIGSMNNAVGKYTGGALTRTVKQTGNIAAHDASMGMARARGAAQKTLMADPAKGKAAIQSSIANANTKLSPKMGPEGDAARKTMANRATSSRQVTRLPLAPKPPAVPNPAAKPASQPSLGDRFNAAGRKIMPAFFYP